MFPVIGYLGIGTQEIVLLAVLFLVEVLPAMLAWKISAKAGLSPALGLITLVPFGILIFFAILAYIDWPAVSQPRRDSDST